MRQNMYSWAVSRQKSYNTPDGSDDTNALNHYEYRTNIINLLPV